MTSKVKSENNVKWIKSDSGNTYLCKVKDLEGIENPTEADLERLCVNESMNPENA